MSDPTNSTHIKDPDAVLEYVWDWSAKWLAAGDTLASAEVLPSDPVGLTVGTPDVTASIVTVVLSGGTRGTTYRVTCRVTTAGGRVADWTKTIICESR